MKQEYWEQFTKTGRVDDYLFYKGMSICQEVRDRYTGTQGRAEGGGRNSESVDHGDRNDPVSITDRRI